jgi:hypothetical protein
MILFNDKTTIAGTTIANALAFIGNTDIDGSRTLMSGRINVSLESNLPDYTRYGFMDFVNVPYDPTLTTSPAAQAYAWLMANDTRFTGGTQYPVPA